ncbi:MAG TPA: DNA polymerase I, partial [Fibrobacteria bacterium]|nr:DNA polymerase I [Fibrobacteria bacterium]
DGRGSMELSRHLVTLVDDLDLPPVSSLEFKGLDIPRMRQFLADMGMRSLVAQLDKLAGGARSPAPHPDTVDLDLFADVPDAPAPAPTRPSANLQILSDASEVEFALGILASVEKVALHPWVSEEGTLLGLGFSWSEGIGRYLSTPDGAVPPTLEKLLADPSRKWISHDSKALRRALERSGVRVAGTVDDVQLAAYLLAPGDRGLSVERIAQARSGRMLRSRDDLLGGARNRRKASEIPAEELCAHAAGAAEAMFAAWGNVAGLLATEGLDGIYRDLELPLSEILRGMEDQGVLLDKELFASLGRELSSTIADLERRCHEAAGREFNVGSPRQLAEVLFDHLGLKAGRKTETGQRSTDSDTLEALKAEHPLPALVLEHRETTKLLGTYVEPLPLLADPSGRVHTTFHQTVAATGRLSSMDPNLQNIPIRGELGRRIRGGFVASPGYALLSADYSQIELRLLAHLSGDPVLGEVYRAGEDIHARTAARVHGVAPSEVTPDQRRAAKVVNFGVVYGMGPHALAQQTGLPYAEAKRFIEGYFAAYPRVKPYMEEVLEAARREGFVTTLLGRKRWIREINDKNRVFRERAEREAVNTPVQGSAADLVKLAMLAVDAAIREGLPARQLLQVHDELILECPTESVLEVAAEVKRRMEGAMQLSVPLVAETGTGPTWGAAH